MALCQVINGTCAGVPFVFGRRGERRCHGLDMRMPFTHAVFAFVGWAITVRGNHVYDRLSGPRHRLDVSISAAGDTARRDLPHGACDLALHSSHLRTRAVRRAQRQYVSTCAGLLGQSFSGDGKRDGKRDVYPAAGRFTTSAMAEGAIEGTAAMYEVASPHATDFAFSRFDAKPQQADAKPQQPSSSGEAVPMDASAESD